MVNASEAQPQARAMMPGPIGHPPVVVEPQLDKAISALEAALTAFKYRPADREAYRKGKTTIHEAVPEELTVTDPPSKT